MGTPARFLRVRGWLCRSSPWLTEGSCWRENAAGLVAMDDPPIAAAFNPHAVRRRAMWARERPLYFIAVCRGLR